MSKKLASLLVDMQVNSAQLKAELGKVGGHLKQFDEKLKKIGTAIGATFVGAKMLEFGKASATAFMQSEQASKKLEGSLKLLGYRSNELAEQLKDQAAAFQANLGVSDDMITQMQTVMVAFGVAPKEIKKTTQALLDYSTLMGEDALGSTKKLVEAINSGSMKALKSFGISIADTGDKSKNLAAAVEALGQKFGGAAAANADTLAGQMARMNAQFEDLEKSFGGFLARLNSKLGVMQAVNNALTTYNYLLSPERDQDKAMMAARQKIDAANDRYIFADKQKQAMQKMTAQDRAFFGAGKFEAGLKNLDRMMADALADRNKATAERDALAAKFNQKPGADLATQGQSNAAKKMFGATDQSKEATKSFAEKMAEEIAADRRDREGRKAGLRGDTLAAMDADFEEKEKFRKRREAVEEALAAEQKKLAEAAAKAAERLSQLRDAAVDAAMGLAQQLAGKLGRAGGLFNSALGGAQTGMQIGAALGPKGAAIGAAAGIGGGVLMDLVTSSDAFARTIAISDAVVKNVGESLGEMVAMYNPILRVGQQLVEKALQPFQRVVSMMSRQIENLVPALEPLATTLMRFVDVALSFAERSGVLESVFKQANRWGRALFDASKYVAENMLSNALGMVMIWESATTGLRDALRSLADFDVAGGKPFAGLHSLADGLNALSASGLRGDLAKALDDVTKMAYGEAASSVDKFARVIDNSADATDRQTKAIEKSLGSWLNVPEGYKVALARFDAMQGEGGAMGSVSGTWSNNAPINVTIVSDDPVRIWTKIQPLIARGRMLRYGTEAGG